MKKIAVVLFVVSAALAGCHHNKKPASSGDTGAGSGSAMGSAAGSGDMGSGGGAGSGSAM